jgi:hypothetical protein
LIAPIQKLEDTKGLLHTQGQAAEHVDLRYLALAAIELLIERMGAGGTASRADLLDYLASLAAIQWDAISPDDAATLAEHVFDGLTNASDRRARFKVRLFNPERPGGEPLEFGLLRAEALPNGTVDVRGLVTALFASKQRVPQEALGTRVLMSGRVPELS